MASDGEYLDKDLLSNTAHVNIRRSLSLTMFEGTDEQSGYESLNYISMRYPSLDRPILYLPQMAREALPCSLDVNNGSSEIVGQKCYHHVTAQLNDLVEFLLVNFDSDQHPMHLHGFLFHVLEQGLAQLNSSTGLVMANNPNVQCDDNQIHCECTNCTTNTQLVKDTIIIPSGG